MNWSIISLKLTKLFFLEENIEFRVSQAIILPIIENGAKLIWCRIFWNLRWRLKFQTHRRRSCDLVSQQLESGTERDVHDSAHEESPAQCSRSPAG